MPTVVIPPSISNRIREVTSGRQQLLRVLNDLRDQLENNWQKHRARRDRDDPDYFVYTRSIYSDGRWLNLHFYVNDTRATGYLFVDALNTDPNSEE